MKNEKFLLDIQTKCGNVANEVLNAAIHAEQTFKCKWPYHGTYYGKTKRHFKFKMCEHLGILVLTWKRVKDNDDSAIKKQFLFRNHSAV